MALPVVRLTAFLLRFAPPRIAFVVGSTLGRLVYVFYPWRRTVIRENLRRAGHLDARLVRAAYEHLGRALILTLRAAHDVAIVVDDEQVASLQADCREGGVLICSAHIGVWELVPAVLRPYVPDRSRRLGAIVYRPLHDALLDRWLRRRRAAVAGVAMMADDGSYGALRRSLAAGGLVGLLPDQRPAAGRPSVRVCMLGEPCEMSVGVTALHASSGCAVWFAALLLKDPADGDARRAPVLELRLRRLAPRRGTGGSRSMATARAATGPPSDVALSSAACAGSACVAQAYADELSAAVNDAPSQYLWLHDRHRSPKARRADAPSAARWPPWRHAALAALVTLVAAHALGPRLWSRVSVCA